MKIIKAIFHPNKIIGFILCNTSIFLLIYVFTKHLEDTPIAYVAYLLSTYSLIIFIIWFIKACEFSSNFVKKNSELYHWYDKNKKIITKMMLRISFLINLIYGIFKLTTGIYYKSAWFITFAVYYLLLCLMKINLIFSFTKGTLERNILKEHKKLEHTGIVLLLLDIVLSGMIILIIHKNEAFFYPGTLIYGIALYDFYLIISAIVNVFKYHNHKSAVLTASKCINLTVAMISMISLEVAMIYQFGDNDIEFKNTMIGITGFIVAVINSIMAIYLIVKSKILTSKDNVNIMK